MSEIVVHYHEYASKIDPIMESLISSEQLNSKDFAHAFGKTVVHEGKSYRITGISMGPAQKNHQEASFTNYFLKS